MKKYNNSLFIFRRDLRLNDNTALIEALKNSHRVACIFIFDPRQVKNNSYKSDNAIQFMVESLQDLERQIKKHKGRLYFFEGKAEEIIGKLLKTNKFEAIFINADYTPFSIKRDSNIQKECKKNKVDFHRYHDTLLNQPLSVLKKDKKPYQIFTPYFKAALKNLINEPHKAIIKNYYTDPVPLSKKTIPHHLYKKRTPEGGSAYAKKILSHIGTYKDYATTKDFPMYPTTGLSAHLKFGTCSIREAYHAIRNSLGFKHSLLRQLYWRDFFTQLAFHFPHVFEGAFQKKYNKISWKKNDKHFKAWCMGKTGFPIVDAGMRELNTTGSMHNRVRMIVASFLVKDLHLNWQDGEKYFAQQLTDYDPAVNNGNWQWCASTGADAQPYFRIFNPWQQQKKFDPKCVYIKKWIPELSKFSPSIIHSPKGVDGYAKPIIDHKQEAKYSISFFKKIAKAQ